MIVKYKGFEISATRENPWVVILTYITMSCAYQMDGFWKIALQKPTKPFGIK
jgi:hypothetical protein